MGLGKRERGVILKRAPEKTPPPPPPPFTQAAFETKKKQKPSQVAPCALFTV